jgi:hypothetical protein
MIVKCKCGGELQLSEVIDEDEEIYNCDNEDCDGRVIINKFIEVSNG